MSAALVEKRKREQSGSSTMSSLFLLVKFSLMFYWDNAVPNNGILFKAHRADGPRIIEQVRCQADIFGSARLSVLCVHIPISAWGKEGG